MDLSRIKISAADPQRIEGLLKKFPVSIEYTPDLEIIAEEEKDTIYLEPSKGYVTDVKFEEPVKLIGHDEWTFLFDYEGQKYALHTYSSERFKSPKETNRP